MQVLRIGLRLLSNTNHRFGEFIECFNAFRLSRLDHHGFIYDQREIDCRCMVAKIKQTLCHIQRADAKVLLLPLAG